MCISVSTLFCYRWSIFLERSSDNLLQLIILWSCVHTKIQAYPEIFVKIDRLYFFCVFCSSSFLLFMLFTFYYFKICALVKGSLKVDLLIKSILRNKFWPIVLWKPEKKIWKSLEDPYGQGIYIYFNRSLKLKDEPKALRMAHWPCEQKSPYFFLAFN